MNVIILTKYFHYFREDLIRNRVQLIETLCLIFKDYSINPDVYEFDIECENPAPLLPEVIPIDGKNYVDRGCKY